MPFKPHTVPTYPEISVFARVKFGTRPHCNGRVREKVVTVEDIQQFVTAHVQDAAKKSHLIAQMHAMGVKSMPDVHPSQYNELLTRWRKAIRAYERGQEAIRQAFIDMDAPDRRV